MMLVGTKPRTAGLVRAAWLARLLAGVLLLAALGLAGGCCLLAPAGESLPADLTNLSQDPVHYYEAQAAAHWQATPSARARLQAEFLRNWYQPWDNPDPSVGIESLRQDAARLTAEPGVGENLRPIREVELRALMANCALADYPNAAQNALTVRRTNLRLLPSARPSFADAGDFPFDRRQQTSLQTGSPVRIHHYARDRAWALVQSPLAWGWLPVEDLALVTPADMAAWREHGLAVAVADEAPLYDAAGRHLGQADLGALLPLAHPATAAPACGVGPLVLVPARRPDAKTEILPASSTPGAWVTWPLPLSGRQAAALSARLVGQPYGWGGLFGRRDCSAMIRELMAAMGLWLPRNSSDQFGQAPVRLDMAGRDPEAKEAAIAAQGVPFLSILWMPGHVMLYLGQEPGGDGPRAVVLHDLWGLRLKGDGRLRLSSVVITSLAPGDERTDLDRPQGILRNRVEGLALPVEREALRWDSRPGR